MAKVITITVPNDPVEVLTIAIPQVGPAGPAALLSIGTVNTLAAGVNGTASITGTPPNYVLNLGLPVGVYSRGTVAVTASRTLALTDAGKTIDANHATVPIVLTIPLNSAVAFPIGTLIGVNWDGVAAVTLAATGGVTTTGGGIGTTPAQLSPRARYSAVNLRKTGTDSWHVEGDFLEPTDATVAAATSSATANTLALRDGSGNVTFNSVLSSGAQGTGATALTRKDYVDAADLANANAITNGDSTNATNITNVSNRVTPLETANTAATSSATNNTLVLRSATATASFTDVVVTGASPAGTSSATRRDYVDNQDLAFRREQFTTGTASYTFVLSDEAKVVIWNSASATTFTVPDNTAVALPVGSYIDVVTLGTGALTIAPAAGVTVSSPDGSLTLRARYSSARLWKQATNTWIMLFADTNDQTVTDLSAATATLATATSSATNNSLVQRSGTGTSTFTDVVVSGASPAGVSSATRRDYVDAQDVITRRTIPLIVSASRTLALTDEALALYTTNASAATITVPLNSVVAFPVGAWIDVIRFGAGTVTFAPSAGVTISSENSSLDIRALYGRVRLTKLTTDTWSLSGDSTSVTDAAVTNATASATAGTLALRDGSGGSQFTTIAMSAQTISSASNIAARKDYVDGQDRLTGRSVTVNTTFALTDGHNYVASTSSSALTFTIPLNSAVAFTIGDMVDIIQFGTGIITLTGTAGVSITSPIPSPYTTQGPYSRLTAIKTGTDTWVVYPSLYDSGWISLTPGTGFTASAEGVRYKVKNGICYVHMNASNASWAANATLATIPTGARPIDSGFSYTHYGAGIVYGGVTNVPFAVSSTTGALTIIPASTAGGVIVTGSWPIS